MRKYISLSICFMLTFAAFSCKGQEQSKAKTTTEEMSATPSGMIHRVGLADFKEQLSPDVQLVDVRTPQEYEAGYIGHAVNYNINGPDFKAQVEALDKSKPVLVYCKMGGRSAKAAKVLKELGFSTIYDLEGGYSAWSKE